MSKSFLRTILLTRNDENVEGSDDQKRRGRSTIKDKQE